ncbi:monooxygenase [Podospora appendiculata]|uniref:Monooxygenase n=1 Tax=Podospora appendiculata TaxID=314037 RepID=A0AAE0XGU6_9PEZI|nr:monooxygenase [Podospora appendiculata]
MDEPGSRPKMHFVIVGGSLGGLAAGIALKALGHDTTLLERNPMPLLHDQGAGIVAGGDALEFFERLNRCKRPTAVRSKRRQYVDKEGNIVNKLDTVHDMSSWDLTYHIMRANYDGKASLYCDIPPPDPFHGAAVHHHDRTVTGIEEDGPGVRVNWKCTSDPQVTGSLIADRLVGADGPGSTVRSLFVSDVQRTYAGYCALRGTVPENEASTETRETFAERFTFFHGPGVQVLAYLIPGVNGTVEPGHRLINFVYYTNFPEGSPELNEILTDRHGQRHRITLPPGMTDPAAWEKQRAIARERLPPQFAEIVCKAKRPFVQAVTDVISPEHEFLGGKVVLIGDALAGFRPHTVASTSQAAFDAMILADYISGKIGREEWKKQTMGYARYIQKRGVDMGNRSQFQQLPLEEYVKDRDVASTPRRDEVYPAWATAV